MVLSVEVVVVSMLVTFLPVRFPSMVPLLQASDLVAVKITE